MKAVACVLLMAVGVFGDYGAPAVRDTPTPLYTSVRDLPAYGGSVVRAAIPVIPITRFSQDIKGGVSDATEFESGNGIKMSESTQIVAGHGGTYEGENGQMVKSESSVVRSGSYSYTAPDGTPITMSWTADENGFRVTGDHVPTSPPVPADIAEAVKTLPTEYETVRTLKYSKY